MIRAALFDFYGVIISDDMWQFAGVDKMAEDDVHELSRSVNVGAITWPEFRAQLAKLTGKTTQQVDDMYAAHRVNIAVVTFIKHLAATMPVGLITNAAGPQIRPMLHELGIDQLFAQLVISSEVGLLKPDPRMYDLALNNLEVQAEECVLIDDLARNVDAAQDIGMQVVLFQSAEQLKSEFALLM